MSVRVLQIPQAHCLKRDAKETMLLDGFAKHQRFSIFDNRELALPKRAIRDTMEKVTTAYFLEAKRIEYRMLIRKANKADRRLVMLS